MDEAEAKRERAARAVERSKRMTGAVLSLGEERPTRDVMTPMERIELLVEVSAAAWAMTGQPWPSLPRAQWPIRVRRLGEP